MADSEGIRTKKEMPADLTSAWCDRVVSVLARRDHAIEQMKDNRKKVARLEKEHREMLIRTGCILKEMQNSLTTYTQLICRPFCERIHKVLPRELRDRIYGYLLGPVSEIPMTRTALIKQRRREIWFSESWVGRQFTVEIYEMAYGTDNLQLCSSFNLSDLLLLPEDNGVLPVAHIRSLVLHIGLRYNTCRHMCCFSPMTPPPPPPPPPPISSSYPYPVAELKKSMDPLNKIERKQGFKLDIKLCGLDSEPRLLDVLDGIKPVLVLLREEGMKITIQYKMHNHASNRYPDNLMTLYDVPREEWDDVCKEHRARLKSKGVAIYPPSPPPHPPPPLPTFVIPPPPPMPLTGNQQAAVLPNPPMATVSVAPAVTNVTPDTSQLDEEAEAESEV